MARSIHVVFLFAVPLAVLAFGLTWLLKESPLRETAHIGMEAVAGEPVVPEVEERAQEGGVEAPPLPLKPADGYLPGGR